MKDFMGAQLTLVLVIAIAGLMAGWLFHWQIKPWLAEQRHRHALRKVQQKQLQREANHAPSFRAVSIVPSRPACKLVKRHMRKRYLTAEAPRLPLSGCAVENCRCRYEHHEDRRTEDRRNPFGIDHVPIGIDSNRRISDRRGGYDTAEMA